MNARAGFFITISALLLQGAFLWGEWCAWMVFIFFIPLLLRVVFLPLSYPFFTGLWWGLIFFTGHFWAVLVVLYEKAYGSARIVVGIFLIVYFSLYAGLWFSLNAKIVCGRSKQSAIFLWSIGAWCYFYIVSNFIFWPIGAVVGYCFGSPLVPLAHYPFLLSNVGYLGSSMLIMFLLAGQAFCVLFFTLDKRYGLAVFLSIVPFVVSFLPYPSNIVPSYLLKLGYVQPPPKTLNNPLERAEEINMRIIKELQRKPSATCILMPESSFAYCLNNFPEIIELWGINALSQGYTLCIGSYRSDTCNEYNGFLLLRGCRITESYDKRFLMPFVEKLPWFMKKFSWIKNLFLKSTNEFSCGRGPRKSFLLCDTLLVEPLVCSDLYLQPYTECTSLTSSTPILLLVNDSWFSMRYAQKLMYLYAIYYAMYSKRDILYIGHTYGCWINHLTGKTILL